MISDCVLRSESASWLLLIAANFASSLNFDSRLLSFNFDLLTPFGVLYTLLCCCCWFWVASCTSLSLDHLVFVGTFLVALGLFWAFLVPSFSWRYCSPRGLKAYAMVQVDHEWCSCLVRWLVRRLSLGVQLRVLWSCLLLHKTFLLFLGSFLYSPSLTCYHVY